MEIRKADPNIRAKSGKIVTIWCDRYNSLLVVGGVYVLLDYPHHQQFKSVYE